MYCRLFIMLKDYPLFALSESPEMLLRTFIFTESHFSFPQTAKHQRRTAVRPYNPRRADFHLCVVYFVFTHSSPTNNGLWQGRIRRKRLILPVLIHPKRLKDARCLLELVTHV
jgi:hypothetical protein